MDILQTSTAAHVDHRSDGGVEQDYLAFVDTGANKAHVRLEIDRGRDAVFGARPGIELPATRCQIGKCGVDRGSVVGRPVTDRTPYLRHRPHGAEIGDPAAGAAARLYLRPVIGCGAAARRPVVGRGAAIAGRAETQPHQVLADIALHILQRRVVGHGRVRTRDRSVAPHRVLGAVELRDRLLAPQPDIAVETGDPVADLVGKARRPVGPARYSAVEAQPGCIAAGNAGRVHAAPEGVARPAVAALDTWP